MTNEEFQQHLEGLLPGLVTEQVGGWLHVQLSPEQWSAMAPHLKNDPALRLDFLFCLTCVDWKTHLSVVYHLRSTELGHTLVVKVKLEDREHPELLSVWNLWRTAEFHEREAYDLFGIRFVGHPDLRRLFMTDDWKGWPLRKDYVDEVNMIKL
ncbi:MAG TPA: NADH-quinone oxidoreductase subunit C [Bacteroidia bacterium]|uniref:NADH-quinone oxidoreductase subunit C n=1 Tax=Candidatus Pollutiaquabacter sp. TaxID=3416354 RepID=UPI002C845AD3|nr:NADH-quinone oxidoreductase subunit C [Bacteroidia bacterium]